MTEFNLYSLTQSTNKIELLDYGFTNYDDACEALKAMALKFGVDISEMGENCFIFDGVEYYVQEIND